MLNIFKLRNSPHVTDTSLLTRAGRLSVRTEHRETPTRRSLSRPRSSASAWRTAGSLRGPLGFALRAASLQGRLLLSQRGHHSALSASGAGHRSFCPHLPALCRGLHAVPTQGEVSVCGSGGCRPVNDKYPAAVCPPLVSKVRDGEEGIRARDGDAASPRETRV